MLAEDYSNFNHSNKVAKFIFNNCMNPILSALIDASSAILDENKETKNTNIMTFLYLLIAATVSLIVSMAFLMPVIRRAKNSKQEVFELFTHKKIEKCVDEQLKKFRWFTNKY
jgi:hypothetical protein